MLIFCQSLCLAQLQGVPALKEKVRNFGRNSWSLGFLSGLLYYFHSRENLMESQWPCQHRQKKEAIQMVERIGFGIRQSSSFSLLTLGSCYLLLGINLPHQKQLPFVYGFSHWQPSCLTKYFTDSYQLSEVDINVSILSKRNEVLKKTLPKIT